MRRVLVFLPLIVLVIAWPILSGRRTGDSSSTPLQPDFDFGDAQYLESWGGYPTLLAHDGARHVIGGPWLGDVTDAPDDELDGQPEATALGDDNFDANDDEDGVTVPTLYVGHPSDIQVEVNGGGGVVEAWIDFNNDHQWQHPGEQIYAGYLSDGVHTIPVATPTNATPGQTCARFRISTAGGLAPTGEAADGEVEDHAIWIEGPTWDYGDAPDGVGAALYPTLLMHNGARHLIRGPWLGDERDNPDADTDGQPHANGLGDDNDGGDDEDGVLIPSLLPGNPADLTIQVSGGGGYVDGWIDFDGDKTWQHPGEQMVSGHYADGIHVVPITVPGNAEPGQTFARFRISNAGGLLPDGPADYGEVEDYEVTISYKWEQMPDLDTTGIAVTIGGGISVYTRVADDFECRQSGYITEVQLWLAEKDDDEDPDFYLQAIILAVYSNLPDSLSPSGFAQPDSALWYGHFGNHYEMDLTVWDPDIREGWYEVDHHVFPADTVCWHATIPIPPEKSFYQMGTPDNPQTYWLVVYADFGWNHDGPIGWKATYENWNAAAVIWDYACDPWCQLIYPPTHEFAGQQMDMAFRIITEPGLELDWGDAPDDPESGGYPTLYAHGGARHVIGGPWLGDATDNPDGETDGQPDTKALGDNTHGDDDEGGVQIPELFVGHNADIIVEVNGGGGFLQGWIDFNQDQVWDNATEMIIAQSLTDGMHMFSIPVPSDAVTGTSFARFRISSVGDLEPGDRAEDGEVEDYEVAIKEPGTGVEDGSVPHRFELYQSVPNPFNPMATIRYDVPPPGGVVVLRIYDVSGRLVRTLAEGVHTAGSKTVVWDGRDNEGRRVASGVYFYRLTSSGFERTRKMLLLR